MFGVPVGRHSSKDTKKDNRKTKRVQGGGWHPSVGNKIFLLTLLAIAAAFVCIAIEDMSDEADAASTFPEGKSIPYDGKSHVIARAASNYRIAVNGSEVNSTTIERTNAGSYVISERHMLESTLKNIGTVTITKAELTLKPNNVSITYGSQAPFSYTFSGFKNKDSNSSVTAGTMTYTVNGSSDTTKLTPNTYTINISNKNFSATNYTLSTNYGTATLTVTKASSSITTDPTAATGLVWDGESHALLTSGGAGTGGTLMYKLGSGGSYSTSIPTATAPGTYTIYYKIFGDSNHNNSAEKSIQVTIEPPLAAYTAPTPKENLIYTGSALELLNPGSSSEGTVKYSSTSGGTYSTSIPTATAAGSHTVYFRVDADANHTSIAPIAIQVNIAKATPEVTGLSAKDNL